MGPGIGRVALEVLLAAVAGRAPADVPPAYRSATGRVGGMELDRVLGAVTTCAERAGLVGAAYREVHALYHATEEALRGVLRDRGGLREMLRTLGVTFAVVRGPRFVGSGEADEWLAVAMFGTAGAPRRGWEHEVVGLGINHI